MNKCAAMVPVIVALPAVISNGCREARCPDDGAALTEEQIIEKANKVIVAEEFSLDMMSRIYLDPDNNEWKQELSEMLAEPYPDFAVRYKKTLKGRCYQAVWYVPDMNEVIAGRLCVFVDKHTGEVITFCGGL